MSSGANEERGIGWIGALVRWQGRVWVVQSQRGTLDAPMLLLTDYYGWDETCEAPALEVEAWA